jgi:cytochrome c-type biogenesis protein CcmH
MILGSIKTKARVLIIASVSLLGCLAPSSLAQVIQPMPTLNREQEDQVRILSARFRCLVCSGQSVEASNSEFSQEVRRKIAEFVIAGKTQNEIEAFFAARYGDSILLEPPKKGLGIILWGVPILVLLAGAGVWWSVMARKSNHDISPEMLERIEREMLERNKEIKLEEVK